MTKTNLFADEAAADSSTEATDTSSFVEVMQVDNLNQVALKLVASPRHSVIGTESGVSKTQICATITARDLPEDEHHRAPVDIMVAMDASASMSGRKHELTKKSLELLVRSLSTGDRFGLISFSDQAIIEIPLQKHFVEHKETALRHIRSLKTRSCTNISAAIGLAAQEMRNVSEPNPVRVIFLLTDGLANRGIQKCEDLVQLTKNHCLVSETTGLGDASPADSWVVPQFPLTVASLSEAPKSSNDSDLTLHCFGYGSDHDARTLQAVSQATPGGTYYFVEDDSNVLAAFGDALGGVFSVVAQNAVLNISVPPEAKALGVEIVQVHHKNKIAREDGSISVTVGDFYAEESRDVLFEVALSSNPPNPNENLIRHAMVSMSYTDTRAKGPASCEPVPCEIARISGSTVSAANTHVKVQVLRIRTTEAIAKADRLSMRGDLGEARSVIDNVLENIHDSSEEVRSHALVKQLIADLNRIKEGLVSKRAYAQLGTPRMRNTMATHSQQRSMESGGTYRSNVYRGRHKAKTTWTFETG